MGARIELKTKISIYRFKDPTGEIYRKLKEGVPAEKVAEEEKDRFVGRTESIGNVLLNCGASRVIDLMIGAVGSEAAWSHENTLIGVGNGTDAEDPSQTDLTGTETEYNPPDGGYPVKDESGTQVTYQSTFGANKAAFEWNEFVVKHSDGTCLNRKVSPQGTKPAEEVWTAVITITLQ